MNKHTAQLIINKVKQDYETIAEQFSNTRYKEWDEFNTFSEYLEQATYVLDVGCGNGRLLFYLKDKQINYTGIDISPKLIEIAQKLSKGDELPHYRFISGDFTKLPFNNQEFDLVFAIASIYHIPSNELRLEVFREVARVLKKNGIFIMTYWNMWHHQRIKLVLKNILKKLIGQSQFDFFDAVKPWKNSSGEILVNRYCHAFTIRELRRLLIKAKLIPLKIYYSSKGRKTIFWNGFNGVLIARKR